MARAPGIRLLRVPREPSAAGMIMVSGLAGLAIAWPPLSPLLALPLAALLLHFFTFDAAFDALRAGDKKVLALVLALNAAPYAAAALLEGPGPVAVALLAGLGVTGAHVYTARRLGMKNPYTYVTGAAVPVLPALAAPALAGVLDARVLVFWALLTLYSMVTAAYVESRLAFRSFEPRKPLALWLPVFASTLYCPYLAAALAEPTAKLVANTRRNRKVSRPEEIKAMGLRELLRLFAFVALAAPIVALCGRALKPLIPCS